MFTEPPPASSRSIIFRQSRVYDDAEDIPDKGVAKIAAFCRKVSIRGRYAITLTEFYMVGEWIEAFTLSGFVSMPY